MKIDVERGGSPLDIGAEECPRGLEKLVLSGAMKHDGQGDFLNFEITSPRQLSSMCFWLESKRPGLRVSKLVPKHISREESQAIREAWTEVSYPEDPEWTIRICRGRLSFLMSMQFEWRN